MQFLAGIRRRMHGTVFRTCRGHIRRIEVVKNCMMAESRDETMRQCRDRPARRISGFQRAMPLLKRPPQFPHGETVWMLDAMELKNWESAGGRLGPLLSADGFLDRSKHRKTIKQLFCSNHREGRSHQDTVSSSLAVAVTLEPDTPAHQPRSLQHPTPWVAELPVPNIRTGEPTADAF
jgi:hypothetical protein